jgi:hypothetical protein
MNLLKRMVSEIQSQYRATLTLSLSAVTLVFSLILLSPAYAGDLKLGDLSLSNENLVYGGVLALEFFIGRSSLKSNSTIELVLNIAKMALKKGVEVKKTWRF